MKTASRRLATTLLIVFVMILPEALWGAVSQNSKDTLSKLLLGKEVKPLVEPPATKEGVNVYFTPPKGKRIDERGLDLEEMSKYLKSKGVGVVVQQMETITDVRFDNDRVEIHLGGGGEGRRGSGHAAKVSPGYQRAGGSRVNFRYGRDCADTDLAPQSFLKFMARILDVSEVQGVVEAREYPPEIKQAIAEKIAKEGMNYQMVMMAMGDPEQKKINDTTDGSLSETWYYLKEGHRWVLTFSNGKVTKVQVF